MAVDPEILRHKEWLGFLQPVGLVVSPPALVKAQAVVNRDVVKLQQSLLVAVSREQLPGVSERAWITDFPLFAAAVLEWQPDDFVEDPERLTELEVVLPDYSEVLTPTYAVPNPDSEGWMMLVQITSLGAALDEVDPTLEKSGKWHASPQLKFERLLREKEIPIGLLCNGTELRVVYAPRGESSGHLTFPVQAMCEVSGRLILGAMEMLLSAYRLFTAPSDRRLPVLLAESRKYQAEVSTKLAGQVLDALWELLRGFQAANAATNGKLLDETDPQHIYGGLITTLLRLVFLLYAEDEGLMPGYELYQLNYAVSGLYERLRTDTGNYPDTMDQRYGAWIWLLSLFRLVYDGGGQTPEYLPARHGQLFEPDEYPFLEGRLRHNHFVRGEPIEPPRIPDGVVCRVLQNLLILDGERLSYRSLDVEQIGSVYEGIMGYAVERARSPSIGLYSKPKGSKVSTTVVVDVATLLASKAGDRPKLLKDWANCEVTGSVLKSLKEAKTKEDLVAALGRKVSRQTPNLLLVGALYLQPGEERRRSGSHYTPRSLTKPIVETTLRPVLEAMGERPTAEQILELKVCDLAMGSGAFLVEACRQLADKVVEAWGRDGLPAELPDGEEALLYARRLAAQRCLYGVDKNPFAVNLAKLSLWLVTLSKDLPFTFLDHALKYGDSLVGLTRKEIAAFGQENTAVLPLLKLLKKVDIARSYRTEIQSLDTRSNRDDDEKRDRFRRIEQELQEARLVGDVAVAAFFEGSSNREREEKNKEFAALVRAWRKNQLDVSEVKVIAHKLQCLTHPVKPFHWEIEFPEVFDRKNPGFDVIVENPPFAGKNTTINAHTSGYSDWLKLVHLKSHGNSDLVAHFFRRAFNLLRLSGTFGLIATNTIAQGDTRNTGLRWICQTGGTIYNAQRRLKWPGLAAVVVSVINIQKGDHEGVCRINGREVKLISAFLFHTGGHENPAVLLANSNQSFIGSYVLGMGFTFDDSSIEATPIAEMYRLIEKNPKNQERIFPYIGGEEVNSSPNHAYHRYVINFFDVSEDEAWEYSDLMQIVKDKVKPERDVQKRDALRIRWWQYAEKRPGLVKVIAPLERVLVISAQAYTHFAMAFQPSNRVFSHALAVIAVESYSGFCTLQSRTQEIWARFFSGTAMDLSRYNPSDCFQTFPFPENWETNPTLEDIGKEYYEYRAALMIRNNQGLTDTYNRFHDPDENHPDILKLRQLHAACDRVVLDAYGWTDISTVCTFLLDYEEEEEEESSTGRQKRKPWRYRWSEETHDEVLARLLDLNQKRAEAERIAGAKEDKANKKGTKKKANKSRKANSPNLPNFSMAEEDI